MNKHLLISKRETKDKRKIPLKSDFGEPKSIFRLIKGAWLTHGPLYHQKAHSSMNDNLRKPHSWTSVSQFAGSSSKESSLSQQLFDVAEEGSWILELSEIHETCKLPWFLGLGSLPLSRGQNVLNGRKRAHTSYCKANYRCISRYNWDQQKNCQAELSLGYWPTFSLDE